MPAEAFDERVRVLREKATGAIAAIRERLELEAQAWNTEAAIVREREAHIRKKRTNNVQPIRNA